MGMRSSVASELVQFRDMLSLANSATATPWVDVWWPLAERKLR